MECCDVMALDYTASPTEEDRATGVHHEDCIPQTTSTAPSPSRRLSDHDQLEASAISLTQPAAAQMKKALGPEDFALDLEFGRQRAVRLDSVGIDEDGERRQRTVRHSQVPSKLSVQAARN